MTTKRSDSAAEDFFDEKLPVPSRPPKPSNSPRATSHPTMKPWVQTPRGESTRTEVTATGGRASGCGRSPSTLLLSLHGTTKTRPRPLSLRARKNSFACDGEPLSLITALDHGRGYQPSQRAREGQRAWRPGFVERQEGPNPSERRGQ
jgi:hypothetical protein